MSYNVYMVTSAGLPRDHHAIFVEMDSSDQSGRVFQVTGNIQQGMSYENKAAKGPEDSATFQGKELLGKVTEATFAHLQRICGTVPVPKKQFEGAKRLYPGEPLRRCQEWTAEAIQALRDEKVLEN